jgi:hypothetical protein
LFGGIDGIIQPFRSEPARLLRIEIGALLEDLMPWKGRVPPLGIG